MLKDEVLKIIYLEDGYISGETISRKLGVTRAAVNSAVKALRDEGYEITSSTNRGYLLVNSPDVLTKGSVSVFLPDKLAADLYVFDSVDSTNNVLKEMAGKGAPSGTVVIADHQTGGKGRLGRSFSSPAGVGIYLSFLFKPDSGLNRIADLTSWTAVAVCDAIYNAYGIDTKIKWVNDIVLNRKKICGILTEATVEGESGMIDNCIIGIGINVNESSFPEELSQIATSISLENGQKTFDRSKLAAELIRSLNDIRYRWPDDPYYINRYRKSNITAGSRIVAYPRLAENSTGRPGTAVGINDDFTLNVRFDDGTTENLRSGEVSVRGLYGYT